MSNKSQLLPLKSSREATSRRSRARTLWLAAALSPVLLLFTLAQVSQLSQYPTYNDEPDTSPSLVPKRLGVVNFVDSKDSYLWGVYSIHKQMIKFNMTPQVSHVALVASDLSPESKALLVEWLGPKNVRDVDVNFVRNHVPDGLWYQVFSKIEAFNVTDFDKLIVLDIDIFIRQSIMHWFDYPAPAATQARGSIEWNSGAMVIEPSTRLYNKLLEYIPKTRLWKPQWDDGQDTWNSGRGHQGFLSSFFLSNVTDESMFTMSFGASVLSSDLVQQDENHYFWKYRNNAIETMHFTNKPWSENTHPRNVALCTMFREWLESVADAPLDRMKPLPNFLQKCPPAENAEARKREQMLTVMGTLGLRYEEKKKEKSVKRANRIKAKKRVDA
jgi:hypothetical protein